MKAKFFIALSFLFLIAAISTQAQFDSTKKRYQAKAPPTQPFGAEFLSLQTQQLKDG
jgi:hypothetical protein